jgi:Zn-finger nucleic acid-binding protein
MTPKEIGQVALDECPQCKGIWFDKDELSEATEEMHPDLRWMDFEIWDKNTTISANAKARECPRCREIAMQAIHYPGPDIDITFCPFCEGVWLGVGDFKSIINAFEAEASNKSVAAYVKASLKEASELVTNPTSFISEWKDLKAVMRMMRYRVFVANPKIRNVIEGIQKSLPL